MNCKPEPGSGWRCRLDTGLDKEPIRGQCCNRRRAFLRSVRYVALVKWKPTAMPEQIRAAQARVPEFVPRMQGIVGIAVAPAIEIASDGQRDWDFAYIADFGNIDDFKVHQTAP